MNQKRYLFVDEAGDTNLPKSELNDYYVICSLAIESNELEKTIEKAIEIVCKHAGNGELKSSNIGNNHHRRKIILNEISDNFPFYALVIDKTKIWKDSGLHIRSSFYKFLHKMLYNRLKQSFYQFDVQVDYYGGTQFMESFKKYIQEKGNIFETFSYKKSQEAPLLQIADVIAGSIRRVCLGSDEEKILKPILNNNLIEYWPPKIPDKLNETETHIGVDNQIRLIAINNAKMYVEKNIAKEIALNQQRAEAIRYLLYKYYENPEEYVFRDEIIQHLNQISNDNINKQFFSSEIIGDARDNEVIIISTDSGMKLPNSVEDLFDWANSVNSQIMPYINRVEKARDNILFTTQFDIISDSEHPELHKILNNRKNQLK